MYKYTINIVRQDIERDAVEIFASNRCIARIRLLSNSFGYDKHVDDVRFGRSDKGCIIYENDILVFQLPPFTVVDYQIILILE